MSTTPMPQPVTPVVVHPALRRVRHQAREALVLMAFSAATSVGIAAALTVLIELGH